MAETNDRAVELPTSSKPSTISGRITKATTKERTRRGPKPARDPSAIYFGSSWKPHAHTFPLSNMAANKIIFRGTAYPTSEHLYHAERLRRGAAWLDDTEASANAKVKLCEGIQAILAEKRSPKRAKEIGRLYLQYLPESFTEAWEHGLGLEVMWEVQLAKFEAETAAGARARKALLDTGDKSLIHVARLCPPWAVDGKWLEGGNELGKMLMRMRERLRRDGRWGGDGST